MCWHILSMCGADPQQPIASVSQLHVHRRCAGGPAPIAAHLMVKATGAQTKAGLAGSASLSTRAREAMCCSCCCFRNLHCMMYGVQSAGLQIINTILLCHACFRVLAASTLQVQLLYLIICAAAAFSNPKGPGVTTKIVAQWATRPICHAFVSLHDSVCSSGALQPWPGGHLQVLTPPH